MSFLVAARRLWRATGADLPYGDPLPAHGRSMEGWFWRCTDPVRGRVVVALCGVNAHPAGAWATVAVAVHPGGVVRHATVPVAVADRDRFAVRAGPAAAPVLVGRPDGVEVELDDVRLELSFAHVVGWPRQLLHGSGLVSVVPGLGQYWHPHVLGGDVRGTVSFTGEAAEATGATGWVLDGARPYAERNWGGGFPSRWWWGQAQAFAAPERCVAFAGGRLTVGATGWGRDLGGVVVAGLEGAPGGVIRLAPPLAAVRTTVRGGRWLVDARSARWSVEVVGEPEADECALLPVPLPAERRDVLADHEHLAGRVEVVVRQRSGPGGRWRERWSDASSLAGLEVGSLDLGRSYDALVDGPLRSRPERYQSASVSAIPREWTAISRSLVPSASSRTTT